MRTRETKLRILPYTALFRFWILLVVAFFIMGNPNDTFAETGNFIGIRISKSGTVHLADMDTHRDTLRLTYLPPGKRLFLYSRKHRYKGRDWLLALTDYGVYVYVLKDGTHYYNPAEREEMKSQSFAVIERPFLKKPEGRNVDFQFGPSEVYKVLKRKEFDILLSVQKDHRFHSSWPKNVEIWVPEDMVSVYERVDVYGSIRTDIALRRKNLKNDLAKVKKAMQRKGKSKEAIQSLLTALDQRFIESKECEQEIDGTLDLNALGELDLDSILSPVSSTLKLSGSYQTNVKYPRGTKFNIDRYSRSIPDQGEAVIEIKHETHRKNKSCSSNQANRRLVVSTSLGEKAEITVNELDELGLKHNEGYPIYRCSTEYFALYERLRGEKAVEPYTAALFLAYYARFNGGSRPAECKPLSKR